jgi:putative transcriptional regulator
MIRDARRKLHLTQTALATILGISVRTVQAYEQGRRTPSKSVLMLLELELKK